MINFVGYLYYYSDKKRIIILKMKKLDVQDIKISNYNYTLPDDKIAKYPLEVRSSSKLLLYKDSDISTREF